MSVKFTKDQAKLYRVLEDGKSHTYGELIKALDGDEFTTKQSIQNHFARMRKKINPLGHDIICRLIRRRGEWQLVRLVGSHNNGYR